MLSGIGPANELTPLGIHPIVNNANVGKNLQDQPTFNLQWQAKFPTLNPFFNNATAQAEQLALYDTNKTGLFAGPIVPNTISFNRLPSTSPALKKFGDPSAGPNSPHWVTAFIVCHNLIDSSPSKGVSGIFQRKSKSSTSYCRRLDLCCSTPDDTDIRSVSTGVSVFFLNTLQLAP